VDANDIRLSPTKGSQKVFSLAPRGWSRAGGKDFGLAAGYFAAGDEEDGGCPGWEQVEAGEEFGSEGREERPVPSQQADKKSGDGDVEGSVGRGDAAGGKHGHDGDLDGVGGHGDDPGQAKLGSLEVFPEVADVHVRVPPACFKDNAVGRGGGRSEPKGKFHGGNAFPAWCARLWCRGPSTALGFRLTSLRMEG